MLAALAVTVLISAVLLGVIGLTRWGGHRAVQEDTRSVVTKTRQQLLRALESRRGTLTFLRDTLQSAPGDFSQASWQAMGASAVKHTRHLLGVGLLRPTQRIAWWVEPPQLSKLERDGLIRRLAQHLQLRGAWHLPSTFLVSNPSQRIFLVMLEPLRRAEPPAILLGVFDIKPLLEDFFTATLPLPFPARVFDGQTLLYRTPDWRLLEGRQLAIIVEKPLVLDAARWTLAMQPGRTQTARTLSWFAFAVSGLGLLAGVGITGIVWVLAARAWLLQRAVERRTAALRRALERVRQLATTDELTGLHNRRFFLKRLAWEYNRAKRYRRPLACLMVDINRFKRVNDQLGHPIGDLVLTRVAQELRTALRGSDILARFGGDEFIIALPETTQSQAESVAEKLRQRHIPVPEGSGVCLTEVMLSVGVSCLDSEEQPLENLLEAADRALYTSKSYPIGYTHK